MDIDQLQQRLRAFAAERDWLPFHSPKNLAMALMVEAAELLELFQWLTTAESHTLTRAAADKERVSDEIADVMLYLLQLADHTGVDVEAAVENKLRKNAIKHPAKHSPKLLDAAVIGAKAPTMPAARDLPKRDVNTANVHLFIDWENVQPKDVDLRALAPSGTHVWVFHALQQRFNVAWHSAVYGDRVTSIPIARPGKNALDFHLSYYIGYISARQPAATFIVISNDKGYDSMLEHARDLGFLATRREFHRGQASKTSVQANGVLAKMGEAAQDAEAAASALPASAPSAVVSRVASQSAATAPGAAVSKAVPNTVPPKKSPAEKAVATPSSGSAQPAAAGKTGSAGKTGKAAAAGKLGKSAPTEKMLPSAVTAKAVLSPSASTKKALVSKRVAAKTVVPAKSAVPLTTAQIARRVVISLGKMATNKPSKKSALLKMIKCQAGPQGQDDSTVIQVMSLLQAQRHVAMADALSAGSAVSYPQLPAQTPPATDKP